MEFTNVWVVNSRDFLFDLGDVDQASVVSKVLDSAMPAGFMWPTIKENYKVYLDEMAERRKSRGIQEVHTVGE